MALADDPGRDWDDLEWRVRDKCLRFIGNNPELSAALPDGLREDFELRHEQDRGPIFRYRRDLGWYVASRTGAGTAKLKRLAKERGERTDGGAPRRRKDRGVQQTR